MLRNRDIVYFSCLDWGPSRARPQQITVELAASNRVLYVEPMISVVSLFERAVRNRGARSLMPRLRQIRDSLYLYTPPSLLPFSLRSERLNALNKAVLLRGLRTALAQLRFHRPIVAVSHPSHHDVVGRLDEAVSFYDCMDHYLVLPDRRANHTVLAAMERKLLGKVDLVFVTSERLQSKKEGRLGKGTLVRNGVDLTHFNGHDCRQRRPAEELAGLPRPIVGYIGCVGSWFDAGAVAFLAAARPDLFIVLVGPVEDQAVTRGFRGRRNVRLLGSKPYQDLPHYLDAFAVCLIPFQVNELTRAVNPIKLYEYLAAGKPVVAADLDEIRPFRQVVSIYTTPQDLVDLVDGALREQDPDMVRERVRVAEENTWQRRVEEMSAILDGYLRVGSDNVEMS